MPTTTIQVETEVRDELLRRGRMGESYNDVIRRLLLATRSLAPPAMEPVGRPAVLAGRSRLPLHDRD